MTRATTRCWRAKIARPQAFKSSKCESALTARLHVGLTVSCRKAFASEFGPLQMAGAIMAKPTVLDAENHAPSHIFRTEKAGIDRPLLGSIVWSGRPGDRKGPYECASVARFGGPDLAHDYAGLECSDVTLWKTAASTVRAGCCASVPLCERIGNSIGSLEDGHCSASALEQRETSKPQSRGMKSIGEISIAPQAGRDFGNSRRAGNGNRTVAGAST